ALHDRATADRAMDAGADDYIPKLTSAREVADRVGLFLHGPGVDSATATTPQNADATVPAALLPLTADAGCEYAMPLAATPTPAARWLACCAPPATPSPRPRRSPGRSRRSKGRPSRCWTTTCPTAWARTSSPASGPSGGRSASRSSARRAATAWTTFASSGP